MTEVADVLAIQAICKDLAARTAYFSDLQDYEAFVDLFTPDAQLVRPGGQPLVGREQILQSYRSKSADRLTRHFVTQSVVYDITADSANMTSYVLLWSSSRQVQVEAFGRKADTRQVAGEFIDRVVRTPEGWKIAERAAAFHMYTE
jgi:ketosteroid isomerase-like protein